MLHCAPFTPGTTFPRLQKSLFAVVASHVIIFASYPSTQLRWTFSIPAPSATDSNTATTAAATRIDKWPCASFHVESLLWGFWSRTPWPRACDGVDYVTTIFLQPSHCRKGCILPAIDVYPSGCTAGRCHVCHCRPIDPTCPGSSHPCSSYPRATTHHRSRRDRPHSSEHRCHREPGLSFGPQNHCFARA